MVNARARLATAAAVKLAAATAAAAAGGGLLPWSSALTWRELLGNSCSDVAVAAWSSSAALALVVLAARGGGAPAFAYALSLAFQLLLLAKAVAVAVLADEVLWPRGPGRQGLVVVYTSLVLTLLASFWESAAVRRAIAAARAAPPAGEEDGDLAEPLLGGGRAAAAAAVAASAAKAAAERKPTIRALLALSRPDAGLIGAAFAAGSVAALGQALIPFYTGRIIDYASIDPNPAAFRATTARLLAVAAACAAFTGVRGGLFTVAMTRLNLRLRTRLFGALLRQEQAFFDATRTGEITSRLSADTTTVSDQVCLNLNVALRSATQALLVLGFMFAASWRLTVATFVMVPCVVAISKAYGRYYRKMSKKVQAELAAANAVAEEALSAMATVKAFAAEGSSAAAYGTSLQKYYALQLREAVAYALYAATNTYLSAAVVAGCLFFGGTLVLAGHMSAGSLVSFMLYQQSLSSSFMALGDVFSALAAAVGAADKVVELMRRRPAFSAGGAAAPATFAGRVELRDVAFAYPTRPAAPVLRGLSLRVEPGQVLALVGPSGGGKSSVVKLLERLYLPAAGQVLFDGIDVGVYDQSWLRRRVALVSQEPTLFARTIRRNILYGTEAEDGVPPGEVPSQADVEAAARLANAHDFIAALPLGYETEAGERGVQLSGGQKQRIAIARALVRRPSVLLLDEATSALDAESEELVQEALDRTMAGRTVVVIAHRLSTVQGADAIAVVREGAVVEQGTHEALLEAGGAYAALVRRQLTRRSASSASLAPARSAADLAGGKEE